jgi:DNA-binding IclR family transcriptional regulator
MAVGTSSGARTGQVVPSVIRAGAILDALASGPPTATLAALSQRLGYPRSSTLALCNSLVVAGLLLRDADGSYRLGPHTLELSRAYLGRTDLLSEFRRAIAEEGFLPDQTLVCAVLRGRDVIYVGSRPGASPLGVNYEIGLRLPAHCAASGLAMLSALDAAEVDRLYGGTTELEGLTPRSITDLDELRGRLAETRERGYAVDDEETALGMLCIGAIVRDDTGAVAGAVAASMAKGARSKKSTTADAGEVQRLAARVSEALGAP